MRGSKIEFLITYTSRLSVKCMLTNSMTSNDRKGNYGMLYQMYVLQLNNKQYTINIRMNV